MNLESCIKQIHTEAAGVLDLFVFSPEQIDELLAAALLGGDAAARRLVKLVLAAGGRISSAPRKQPALCMCCPRPVRRAGTIVLVLPHRDDGMTGDPAADYARIARPCLPSALTLGSWSQ